MPPKSKLDVLRVHLVQDGAGKVYNTTTGKAYTTTLTTCTCPDAQKRGGTYTVDDGSHRCKHMIEIALHTVCPRCGKQMNLQGVNGHSYFECRNGECGWTIDAGLIADQRKARRESEKVAA